MSDLFFEIMQIQPNETEFRSAVRNSNSNETAYTLGFMNGRSYAAQMADEYAYRSEKKQERLVEALGQMHAIAEFREARNIQVIATGELLAQLQAGKGGEL